MARFYQFRTVSMTMAHFKVMENEVTTEVVFSCFYWGSFQQLLFMFGMCVIKFGMCVCVCKGGGGGGVLKSPCLRISCIFSTSQPFVTKLGMMGCYLEGQCHSKGL